MSDSGVELENGKVQPRHRIPLDESDLSSTEDYKVPSDENSPHSSSSFEQLSPCHGKRKLRTRHTTRTGGHNIMREEDTMRTMKRLFQRVAKQKMLIMRNLETDCSKDELSSQIAVCMID